jgi:hypothetical protein
VTIDLPPDIEASLAAQGVPLAEHLCRLLVAQASGSGAREAPAERVKLWRDVSGLPDTKPLSDEAISRESIYSEREENGVLAAELLAPGLRGPAEGAVAPRRPRATPI